MSIEERLERVEAILDARGLDWDHPRVEEDHFAGANKMVVEEPPKKWRILEPGEVVCSSDWVNAKSNLPHGLGWKLQTFSTGQTVSKHDECVFARPVVNEPAKKAEPAWEPKVGDWVRVTRPDDLEMGVSHSWSPVMDKFDGKVGKIESDLGGRFHICGFAWPSGLRFIFDRHWLSPAEPPATEKPAEPEYREPVLPADGGMACEFSEEGNFWSSGRLGGVRIGKGWFSTCGVCWRHCRIKVDA